MNDTWQALIAGAWVEGGNGTFESSDPSTDGGVVGLVAACSRDQARSAVDAAESAQLAWAAVAPHDRGRVLSRAAGGVRARVDELVETIVQEMGKTRAEASIEVDRTADMLDYYAQSGRLSIGDVLSDSRPGVTLWTERCPIGVVALITPWNDPMMVPCRKIAPALVCGNTIVMKPSEHTPIIALKFAEILTEAGLPDGVLNVVTGLPDELGPALVDDERIAGLSFTGSTRTGRFLRAQLADRNVRLQMEMGGKNSAVITRDADIPEAIETLLPAMFGQTGQRCTAVSRLLVEAPVVEPVLDELVRRATGLQVGSGLDEGTQVGPLSSSVQHAKVMAALEAAEGDDARILCGGHAATLNASTGGCHVLPTVIADVDPSAALWRDEIFGPVVAVRQIADIDEAIAAVNDTEYGLAAAVFTRDLKTARRFTSSVHVGQAVVNLPTTGWDVHHPFGGFKLSGTEHKENGEAGLDFYYQSKTVAVAS